VQTHEAQTTCQRTEPGPTHCCVAFCNLIFGESKKSVKLKVSLFERISCNCNTAVSTE
jgi:hypothetical protein